jgi:hypothetical protein
VCASAVAVFAYRLLASEFHARILTHVVDAIAVAASATARPARSIARTIAATSFPPGFRTLAPAFARSSAPLPAGGCGGGLLSWCCAVSGRASRGAPWCFSPSMHPGRRCSFCERMARPLSPARLYYLASTLLSRLRTTAPCIHLCRGNSSSPLSLVFVSGLPGTLSPRHHPTLSRHLPSPRGASSLLLSEPLSLLSPLSCTRQRKTSCPLLFSPRGTPSLLSAPLPRHSSVNSDGNVRHSTRCYTYPSPLLSVNSDGNI